VPVDSTVAVEFFQRAADMGDSNAANTLGACLECGDGIEPNIQRAARYYQSAASHGHLDGMYNFGRCLEYGLGLEKDRSRAAKYYCMAANRGRAAAQNSFGLLLEQGFGTMKNPALAARYYRRAAEQGHPNGANNLGFCLEHGRGVTRDMKLAAEYYKFAADHGDLEAKVNYQRCLRLRGTLTVPDRSQEVACHAPESPDLAGPIIAAADDPAFVDEDLPALIPAIERLQKPRAQRPIVSRNVRESLNGTVITCGASSVVTLECDPDGTIVAVTSPKDDQAWVRIHREAVIHRKLKHPLVIGFREFRERHGHRPAIVMEFVENGTLADHLFVDSDLLRDPDRCAKIIVGIALAMRYVHSCGVVHRDLTPSNILVDSKCHIRITDFGHSISSEVMEPLYIDEPDDRKGLVPSADVHYIAPECFDNNYSEESDVFSFGMILYEIIVGEPARPRDRLFWNSVKRSTNGELPEIPEWVTPTARELIRDCWKDPDDRPSFAEIVDHLQGMNFQLMGRVQKVKTREVCEESGRAQGGECGA
jgi:serine/threonine protein kinase